MCLLIYLLKVKHHTNETSYLRSSRWLTTNSYLPKINSYWYGNLQEKLRKWWMITTGPSVILFTFFPSKREEDERVTWEGDMLGKFVTMLQELLYKLLVVFSPTPPPVYFFSDMQRNAGMLLANVQCVEIYLSPPHSSSGSC